MPRPYPPAFLARAVALVRAGKQAKQTAVELGLLQASVERLDVAVAPRRARRNVAQASTSASPIGHRFGNELRPVVSPQHRRIATLGHKLIELVDELACSDRAIHDPAQAFASVLIDD